MDHDDFYDPVPILTALAAVAVLQGDAERARAYLVQIPRHRRGDVKIALDDLDMLLGRLGRE